MIVFFANQIRGTTGYHKSLVENANALSRDGYQVAIITFLESPEEPVRAPFWSVDPRISVLSLRTLAANGGRLLHRGHHSAMSVKFGSSTFDFTPNELAALRQLNELLSPEDTVIFTSPMQAVPFHRALEGETRRPRTILQIHGDYRVHEGLWDLMMEARPSIDRLRTISSGLRPLFIPTFAEDDVVFIPNASGETAEVVVRREHAGVNIALPASFQPRKNQLDAIRALSMMKDQSARLTLWGAINNANPYVTSVRELIGTLGLKDRVLLAGFGTESDVYSTADVVLMTSSSEGFGRPLLEAAYNGLPTVTYDFDFGPRDALEEGGSGFIVPIGDVDLLAERLELLVADEKLRERFGRRAREVYDERFATEKILERHRRMLGPYKGTSVNLVEAFEIDGGEPVEVDDLVHRIQRLSDGVIHHVTVGSRVPMHDVQIDDGMRVRTPKTVRWPASTQIIFRSSRDEVISYATTMGSVDRHYLANTTSDQTLEVLPWLRRDRAGVAGLSRVTVPTLVWHWWLPGLVHKSCLRIAASARRAPGDVIWKARQLSKTYLRRT